MQIEHVTRIGFAARRTAQQQRHLTIGNGLLRQIVIENDGMHAIVTEVFAHGAARIGCQELHRRRIGSGGRDNDGILQRALFFQRLHQLGDGGTLLTNGDIDAIKLLRFIITGIDGLLVDDGVHDNGGLAGLAVTDDQLALATANWDQGVNRLDAGLHRLMHRFARDDARRLHLGAHAHHVSERTLAINWVAEAIHNATQQALAHGHVHNVTGTADRIAFLNRKVGAENHDADIVGFKVQRHALHAGGWKIHQLTCHDILQPINAGDAIADTQHSANLSNIRFSVKASDLLLEDFRNFSRTDFHGQAAPFITYCRRCSLDLIELSYRREPIRTIRPPRMDLSIVSERRTFE